MVCRDGPRHVRAPCSTRRCGFADRPPQSDRQRFGRKIAARLHRDQTARLLSNKLQQLTPAQPSAEYLLPARIRTVRVRNSLRDIQPDRDTLGHGRPLSGAQHLHSGTPRLSGGAPHQLSGATRAPSNGDNWSAKQPLSGFGRLHPGRAFRKTISPCSPQSWWRRTSA